MKKSIMILGAGIYQVPLINKAKEIGLRTVVCSIPGDYPGFEIADKVYYVDTKDLAKCAEIAQKESISGICTAGTDVAIPTIGYICDMYSLSGISFETARKLTDKKEMKIAFEENKIPSPRFRICYGEDDINKKSLDLSYPLIIKVVDSSGSRGVEKVEESKDLILAYRNVIKFTTKPYVVLEEYIEGDEFGAQVLVQNGSVEMLLPHGDIVYRNGGTSVPVGHYVPLNIRDEENKKILDIVNNIVNAFDIKNSALNIDFIKRGDEIFILEIGARAGATCLPELISYHYDIDYYRCIINLALGITTNFVFDNNRPCAAYLIYSDIGGVLESLEYTGDFNLKLIDISFDYKKGDIIRPFRVGPDRIGQFLICGDSIKDIEQVYNEVRNSIKIVLK